MINALIHPCMFPAYVPQGQNTCCVASLHDLVTLAVVMNLLQLEIRDILPLKLPGGLPWARAGEDEWRALDQDELFVIGCDLQTARLSAEIQEGCRWHNNRKGVRLEVKETAAWGQGLNQQYMPDPVPSLMMKDTSCLERMCGRIMMPLSVTDLFKMSVWMHQSTLLSHRLHC